jgi:hypothetical protein
VADGRHRLYAALGVSGVRTYLARVRVALVGALEDRAGSDPLLVVKAR